VHFEQAVLFTAVSEARVRPILDVLVDEGSAPSWFRSIELVTWTGKVKDLHFILGADVENVLLADDLEAYVHLDQRTHWVPIEAFVAPYPASNCELIHVTDELRRRIGLDIG
jgi:NLI interacting factor-like phosphatase